MYFTTETLHAAKLAVLDQYRTASHIVFDSTERLLGLYGLAGSRALDLARDQDTEAMPVSAMYRRLLPEIWEGHLVVASHAHEDIVRLVEAQIHNSGNLARAALDKTAVWSSPMIFPIVRATGDMIEAGVEVADDLGDATIARMAETGKGLRPARAV